MSEADRTGIEGLAVLLVPLLILGFAVLMVGVLWLIEDGWPKLQSRIRGEET